MTTIRHPSTYDSRRVKRLVSIRVVANRPGIVAALHSNSGPVVIPRLRQENRRRRDAHYHDVATVCEPMVSGSLELGERILRAAVL